MSLCKSGPDLCVGYFTSDQYEIYKTDKGTLTGYMFELMEFTCDWMKLKCEFVEVDTAAWGIDLGNGTWNGLIGAIISGQIDTCVPLLSETWHRREYLSFSNPLIDTKVRFAYRPEIDGQQLAAKLNYVFPIHIFKPKVWAVVYLLMLASGLVLFLHTLPTLEYKIKRQDKPLWRSIIDSIINSLAILIGRDFDAVFQTQGAAKRILIIFWALGSFVICSMYSANLVSTNVSLTMQKPLSSFDGIGDDVATGRYKIIGQSISTSFFESIQFGKNDGYRNLRQGIAQHGVLLYEKNKTIVDYFKEPNNYITWVSEFELRVLEGRHPCWFSHSDVQFPDRVSFAFPKSYSKQNRTFMRRLDDIILYYHGSKMVTHIVDSFINGLIPAEKPECSVPEQDHVHLEQLTIAGSLYASGIAIATLVFILAVIYAKIHKFYMYT